MGLHGMRKGIWMYTCTLITDYVDVLIPLSAVQRCQSAATGMYSIHTLSHCMYGLYVLYIVNVLKSLGWFATLLIVDSNT